MSATQLHEGDSLDPSYAGLLAAFDAVCNTVFVMSARLHEVEESNAELRALLSLDPPKPTLSAHRPLRRDAFGQRPG